MRFCFQPQNHSDDFFYTIRNRQVKRKTSVWQFELISYNLSVMNTIFLHVAIIFIVLLSLFASGCSENGDDENNDDDNKCACTEPPKGTQSDKSCFAKGETMPAGDGCNSCYCEKGEWLCTLMDCGDDDDDNDDDNDDNDDNNAIETLVYLDNLPVIRLKGDAYSRGYELGNLMGDKIVYLYQEYILNYALGLSSEYATLFKLLKNLACPIFKFSEEEMEQIQGIADGITENWDTQIELTDGTILELNENDVCIGNAVADFAQIACSSVSVWGNLTDDGETILARNLDWEPGPEALLPDHSIIMSETPEDESWQLVNITFPGMIGCLSCINGDGQGAFIHDTARYHSNYKIRLQPRAILLRSSLIASQSTTDPVAAFETAFEAGQIDTGNNFHFVQSTAKSNDGAVSFEVDDNEKHADGFVTIRDAQDTDASQIAQTDALIVTNHHRKRYPPGSCWRYESIAQSIATLTEKSGGTLAMDDLHTMMKDVQFDSLTVHTILFKPADWSLDVYRMRADHPASEDPGVHIPPEILFPW